MKPSDLPSELTDLHLFSAAEDIVQHDDHMCGLYARVRLGDQNGLVLEDLGWEVMEIRQALGIDDIVATHWRGTLLDFFNWMAKATGADLRDWEPVKVKLFRCWRTYTPPAGVPRSETDLPMSYASWALEPWGETVSYRKVEVMALRHRAWPLLQSGRLRDFVCALERSWAEAEWRRDHPGKPAMPACMVGRVSAGFFVDGRPAGESGLHRLTWPSPDLSEAVDAAIEWAKAGATDVRLSGPIGTFDFTLDQRSAWRRAASLDELWERRACLLDIARKVGIS